MPAAKTLTKEDLKAKGFYVYLDEKDIEQPIVYRRNRFGTLTPVKPVKDKNGYLSITSKNTSYYLQRVIYAWVNNICPGQNEDGEDMEVDHIDNNPQNNKPSNLRLVTHFENMQNRAKDRAFKPKDEISILKAAITAYRDLALQYAPSIKVETLDVLVQSNIDTTKNDLWNEEN